MSPEGTFQTVSAADPTDTGFILAGSPGAPKTGHCACEGGTGWTHHCGDCPNSPAATSAAAAMSAQ